MIELTIKEVLYMLGGGLAIVVMFGLIVRFLASTWIKARIEAAVKAEHDRTLADYKHELDKKMEEFKNDQKIREQAAKIAEFLAVALSSKCEPVQFNKQAWELSLWLPTDLYIDIARLLADPNSPKEPKDILIKVRRILLREKAGELKAENILHQVPQ